MRVAIMQPTYLPWLGYFDLMAQVDVFVLLDDVAFAPRSWQQRNRIVVDAELAWLTVPVAVKGRRGQRIADVAISEPRFGHKHLRTLGHAYRRAAHLETLDDLAAVLGREHHQLALLNEQLLRMIASALAIKTPLVRASRLPVGGARGEHLARICAALGADTYVSPLGSAGYLQAEQRAFATRRIELVFHRFEHPRYRQVSEPFVPQAAIVDLLLNEGPAAAEILASGRREAAPASDVFAALDAAKEPACTTLP